MAEGKNTPTKRKAANERHPLVVAFGLYLKEVRTARNVSQAELSFDSGTDRTYISLLERGISAPSLLVLNELSKALGITMTELMAGFEAHLNEPSDKVRPPATPRPRRLNEAALAYEGKVRPQGSRRSPLR